MKQVLVLGYPSDGVERLDFENVRTAGYRLVSLSAAVSDILREHCLPHASITEYFEHPGWDEIHAGIALTLRELSGSPPPSFGVGWLDDWSHLIVDEARELFLWSRAAQRLVDVEQPAAVLVQETSESRSSHRALRMIALACRLLGRHVETWSSSRAR
jgi:hypothetical protein